MTNPTIKAALDAQKPALAAAYAAQTRGTFDRMVKMHGPTLRGISNCWTFARTWTNWISPLTTTDAADGTAWKDAPRRLDETRMAAAAEAYAAAAATAWEDKINTKMGDLERAEVHQLHGVGFTITGTCRGHRVHIEQQMTLNVSSKGKPFNQFPARLWIDGKPTSEAAWKRMQGEG